MLEITLRKYHDKRLWLSYLYTCVFWEVTIIGSGILWGGDWA